jgi:hypothetical protein
LLKVNLVILYLSHILCGRQQKKIFFLISKII